MSWAIDFEHCERGRMGEEVTGRSDILKVTKSSSVPHGNYQGKRMCATWVSQPWHPNDSALDPEFAGGPLP